MENIRVDRESGLVVLLQVLNEARSGLHRQSTSRILRRVLKKFPITKMRVNSSGNPNMVGTLEACTYLLDNIPGEGWDKWRKESGAEFRKALIEHVQRKKNISSTSNSKVEAKTKTRPKVEERHVDELLATPSKKGRFELFEHASAEEKSALVSVEVEKNIIEAKKQIFYAELEVTKSYVEALEMVGQPLDGRDKIEVADRIKDGHRRAYGSGFRSLSTTNTPKTSKPSVDPSTGLPLATPKCPLSVRGSETSIPLEAAKLQVRVGERSGLVGREARKLYEIRYGQDAARDIPKRATENVYFSRDSDLIQRAIRNICGC